MGGLFSRRKTIAPLSLQLQEAERIVPITPSEPIEPELPAAKLTPEKELEQPSPPPVEENTVIPQTDNASLVVEDLEDTIEVRAASPEKEEKEDDGAVVEQLGMPLGHLMVASHHHEDVQDDDGKHKGVEGLVLVEVPPHCLFLGRANVVCALLLLGNVLDLDLVGAAQETRLPKLRVQHNLEDLKAPMSLGRLRPVRWLELGELVLELEEPATGFLA